MSDGQDVLDLVPVSDSVKADDTVNLNAINHAIATLWPLWRLTERKDGGTFASGTYEYSLSTLTNIDPDFGISSVLCTPTSGEPIEIGHRCLQRYDHDATAWTLQVRPDIVAVFDTKTFEVIYQYPHPLLTALSDTVYAPIAALAANAVFYYAMQGATLQNVDNAFWRAFAPDYFTSGEPLYQRIRNAHLKRMVPIAPGSH